MRGGKRIILFIIVLAIIAAAGFVWRQKNLTQQIIELNSNAAPETMPPVDQAKLAADYENNLRALLPEYRQALGNPTAEETISDMRQKLLALKLPASFRDLHAQLVLLLDKAEETGTDGATGYTNELEKIIKNNQWLKE
ncbi:hypothetical protein COU01_03070 [Candidatus Falkowbacteria bacterium CG10_big_fil_rev_8_21_14_0_10_44_15]|uniref:Uncharacterized protein n=1 Tax=Candidatus Falkowbacteria bacterium CG10_big_fil_rev_8_21_14_0_10_44_15 TaxID=1974569 RepID=A0A2H0UZE8_9BACT|nr:MAG: hypothetical protein COU01_03070 [Candidatus Falkowbacteria bacterium CG10_big_fil_rev_8_21_14_0_10_44_15]